MTLWLAAAALAAPPVAQASASACAALSLCLVLGGAQLPEEGEVVVTGYLDLRGFVMPVGRQAGRQLWLDTAAIVLRA